MPTTNTLPDLAFIDRSWRGYDFRAAAPRVLIALAASILLLAGRWYLDDYSAALVPYIIVLVLWPALLGVAFYRAITYTYRITDRALLVDRGFRNPPEPPVEFADIARVETGAHGLGRLLGVGWIAVRLRDGRTIKLKGLRHPEEFARSLAAEIEKRAQRTAMPKGK